MAKTPGKNKKKKLNNASYEDIVNRVGNIDGSPYNVGDIVLALAGRDEERLFIVVGVIDKDYVLIADGRSRRIDSPKKKKVKHIKLKAAGNFDVKDLKGGRFTNLNLRSIIAGYVLSNNK